MSFPRDRNPELVPLNVFKECSCEKCRKLCVGRPGWFMPGEATKAAAALGLSLEQFFVKYLTLDYWVDGTNGDVELLSPAWDCKEIIEADGRVSQTRAERRRMPYERQPDSNAGYRAAWGDAFFHGPCALLTPTGCQLSGLTRPSECRWAFGCRDNTMYHQQRAELVKAWKADQREVEQIRHLVKGGR